MSKCVVKPYNEVLNDSALKRIFQNIDPSPQCTSMTSIPTRKILNYFQDVLPTDSTELLLDLQKSLEIDSTNGLTDLEQFKKSLRAWIRKIDPELSQDGNNNAQALNRNDGSSTKINPADILGMLLEEEQEEYSYDEEIERENLQNLSFDRTVPRPLPSTGSESSTCECSTPRSETNSNTADGELRLQIRHFDEENALLRKDLLQAEETIGILQRQRDNFKSRLEECRNRYLSLEKENDEQKDALAEILKKEKRYASTLQKCMKERDDLLTKLEAKEIEVQSISPLNAKLKKLTKDNIDCHRELEKRCEEMNIVKDEYTGLQTLINQLTQENTSLRETQGNTIRELREQNQKLLNENVELQSFSSMPDYLSSDRLSTSPILNSGHWPMEGISYQSKDAHSRHSLRAEFKACGFVPESEANSIKNHKIEEEFNWYDQQVRLFSQQIERIIEDMWGKAYVPAVQLDDEVPTKLQSIQELEERISVLGNVAAAAALKVETKNASTQNIANPQDLRIVTFQDHLNYIRDYPERGPLWIRSDCAHKETKEEDPFLSFQRTHAPPQLIQESAIVQPIIKRPDEIIGDSKNSQRKLRDLSPSERSRYKSIHTLPRHSFLDSNVGRERRNQRSREHQWNKPSPLVDASIGEGHCTALPKIEIRPVGTSSTMKSEDSEFSTADSMELESEVVINDEKIRAGRSMEMDAKTAPRRKISVFQRSFDLVTLEDKGDDRKQTIEVRRSLSSPPTQMEEKAEGSSHKSGTSSRKFNEYRSNEINGSNSSNSLSPEPVTSPDNDPSAHSSRGRCPLVLAPPKLKLPMLKESSARGERDIDKDSCDESTAETCETTLNSTVDESSNVTGGDVVDSDAREEGLGEFSRSREESVKGLDNVNRQRGFSSFDTDSISYSLLLPNATAGQRTPSLFEGRKASDTVDLAVSLEPNSYNETTDLSLKLSGMTFTGRRVQCSSKSSKSSDSTYVIAHSTPLNRPDRAPHRAKVEDPESPHSDAREVRGRSRTRGKTSVGREMSSREDSSLGSDSEGEPIDPLAENQDDPRSVGNEVSIRRPSSSSWKPSVLNFDAVGERATADHQDSRNPRAKKEKRKELRGRTTRSLSESDPRGSKTSEWRCQRTEENLSRETSDKAENSITAFPSLSDTRLEECGIANHSDANTNYNENLTTDELERKYIAFSIGLGTDRLTLNRRVNMSIRQRDQSEKNLFCEVQKMQQKLQEVAPLCTDGESIEKVERARNQLDMIAQCAHWLCCASETLGAVHQEHRISRAIHMADKYLQVLRTRCEKLTADVAETKRILMENNIVIEESPGELGDDLPRIRYRSGIPSNNRMMMARRRASIAAISRPVGTTQETTKENVRQRNSVSGRVTFRRPSLCYENHKWENEKLDRTDSSSSSIGELRDIFEQAESRRNSREENNNVLRINQANNMNNGHYNIVDSEIRTNIKQGSSLELQNLENSCQEARLCVRPSPLYRIDNRFIPWRWMAWCIVIFFLGFYVKHVISSVNHCPGFPFKWWSIEEFIKQYVYLKNIGPRPI